MTNYLENINRVRPADLIRELHTDSADYFLHTELGNGWPVTDEFGLCKFVRFGVADGAKIIVGSLVEYGIYREKIRHMDLLSYALSIFTKPELLSETDESRQLLHPSGMLDAGWAKFEVIGDDERLRFWGASGDFGAANKEGRQETAMAASLLLRHTDLNIIALPAL